uniref:Protein kinase domain-containing protein n=1 Tax=Kalanchoe fedtschenkoi TaxID=63787 RepID=A0A7N0TF81_KALFE
MADSRTKAGFFNLLFIICVSTAFLGFRSCAEPTSDKQALVDFISRFRYSRSRIKWDLSTPACSWTGVVCDSSQTYVYELRLPGVGLVGQIPPETIGRLSHLRVLSLRSNRLSGPLPPDFGNLTSLRSLYLQGNIISGSFPESLARLPGLSRIDVSSNRFEGEIPASISNLILRTLFLQNNRFSGAIPAIVNTSYLVGFNVSNNNLTGEIPETLSKFPESSFAGNLQLCGKPLPSCADRSPSPSPSPVPSTSGGKRSRKITTGAIVGIVVGIAVALLLLLLLLLCFYKRSRRGTEPSQPPKPATTARASAAEAAESSSKEEVLGQDSKHKLVFFEVDKYGFELEDLLKASAEVLGKGSTGSSYMAELDDGTTVAVKRMKEVVVGKKEFEAQMALLGQIRHENLVKLIAYYYSKDEKLLISDYIPTGSLSSLLHGSRGSGRPPLDWITRFRIGLTAAKGLLHLHMAANTPHGNMKSSNILVTKSLKACISDYGVHSLLGPSALPNRGTGYGAPEVQHQAKLVSFKSDVYSFGVVLLELLTGKAPNQVASLGEDGIDLPRWVQSLMAEAFDAEVFDAEVVGSGVEEEMVAVLQVAMKCVDLVPERRPEMWEVVRMLEMVESGEFQSPLNQEGNGSDGRY